MKMPRVTKASFNLTRYPVKYQAVQMNLVHTTEDSFKLLAIPHLKNVERLKLYTMGHFDLSLIPKTLKVI